MTNAAKKGLLTAITFVVCAISMEAFLFIQFGWGVFPTYFLLDGAIILFFAIVICIAPWQWLRVTISSVMLSIQLALTFANISIMHNISSVFSFDMFTILNETVQVADTSLIVWWPLAFLLPLIAAYVVSVVFIGKLKSDKIEIKKFSLKAQAMCLAVAMLASFSLYSFEFGSIKRSSSVSAQSISDESLFSNFYVSTSSLKKFGTYGYYLEELFRYMFGMRDDAGPGEEAVLEQLRSREYDPAKQILHGVCEGDNMIVIMAESFEWYAITPELTPVLFSLANGVDLTKLNAKAGEFFYDFTPKGDGTYSWKRTGLMYQEENAAEVGLSLVNYHSKAKTDYSEHSMMLGSYILKKTQRTTDAYSKERDYSFTLPSMLSSQGYDTAYFHTWLHNFYDRDVLNKRFGFDELYFADQMEEFAPYHGSILANAANDSAFVEMFYDKFTHKETQSPYLTFFTTVSTHGPYDGKSLLSENYAAVREHDFLKMPASPKVNANLWNSYIETYLAAALDTEIALSYLVYNLLLEDKLNETLIVFYADHNNYYYEGDLLYKQHYYNGYYEEYFGKPYYWAGKSGNKSSYSPADPNRYAVPAFVYSPKITDEVLEGRSHYVTDFAQAYDLTTTIFTLLGIDYLPGAYLGYPVYCVAEGGGELNNNIIISATSGIFSEKIYSEDGTEIISAHEGVTRKDIDEFIASASKFYNKWRAISAMHKYDLYKKAGWPAFIFSVF